MGFCFLRKRVKLEHYLRGKHISFSVEQIRNIRR